MVSPNSIDTEIKLHPVSLAFNEAQKPLESLYADYYFEKHLGHFRYCHYISMLFYLFAAIIDYAIIPSQVGKFWELRFGAVVPCFMIGLAITYQPVYRRIWRQLSFFYILITGASFIVSMVLALAPASYTYYIGITICMIFGYTFIREPFLWASGAGCLLLAVYFLAAVAIGIPKGPFLLAGFYLSVINILGMFIAYAFEVQSRKDFFLNYLLNQEKQKVNKLAQGLEKEVQTQIGELQHANEELKREIRERKSIENALRVSERNYRSLQANIPIGLYRIAEGEAISANPAMVRIFGAENEKDLLSQPVVGYLSDPSDIDPLYKELHEKGTIVNAEVRLKRLDGRRFWGLVNVAQAVSEDRSGFFYDGTLEDITTRKAMAEEKEILTQQLRQAHKMESLGTLAGGIAHDFNNILTAVIGYTELALDETAKGSSIHQNLVAVKKAGNRAKTLVKQILTFARQSDETLTPVRVDQIAEETLRFLRSSIPSTIKINSRITTKRCVLGNATQLHQVLMNLCTNAAHAMEDSGGVMEIDIEDQDRPAGTQAMQTPEPSAGFIQIRVSDTGRGIPSDSLGVIFEPYFTTKGPGEGTGMGLAVVHGIVESYGGTIHVESRENRGTVFTIILPVTPAGVEAHPEEDIPEEPKGNETILVIDDELAIADMTGRLLERLGYRTTVMTSSVGALDLFRAAPQRFDLVVTDMTMPVLTGKKLTAELLQIRSDLPVILCTGYSRQIDKQEAERIGARALLHKPVSRQHLAKAVRTVLDGSGAVRA